uniref:DUF8040 domain-containing protein n=1 Tax=Nelumbo nucifera TaxID=4432 RepID=A0A822Z767_NELNU|nr:TPA_asm: hypothetical protein HUJ06_015235 [Nelumbo nucifera]
MSIPKTPYHDDILAWSKFLKNVIYNGGTRCLDMFKLTPPVLLRLVASLRQRGLVKDNRYVSTDEHVGILLQVIEHNKSNQNTANCFQHSSETISWHFNTTLKAICEFGKEIVQPNDLTVVSP